MNYIKSLKIKSFFSIKNEIEINFLAHQYTSSHYQDRVFSLKNSFFNKTISFYGANASGKTSILKAIIVIAAVINNDRKDFLPTSLKNIYSSDKTRLIVNFIIDNKEYEYEIVLKANKSDYNTSIIDEKLYLENKIIFDREKKVINLHNLTENQKEMKEIEELFKKIIFSNLNKNISLFNDFEKFDNTHILKKIRKFFKSILETTNIEQSYTTTFGINIEDELKLAVNIVEDDKIKKFLIDFLSSINIDISDIKVDFEKKQGAIVGIENIYIYHKINNKKTLEYRFESDGTKQLLKFLLYFYNAYKNKSVLVIDEFDSVIHPKIIPYLINLLQRYNIQTLYTTHNIYNLKLLYADEIFFIKKDEQHNTTICSPKDYDFIEGFENFLSLYENDYLCNMPKIPSKLKDIKW